MNVLPDKFKKHKRFFWLTTFDEDSPISNAEDWFWGPIWYSLDAEDNTMYKIG